MSRLVFKFDPIRFFMRDPPVHAALNPRILDVNWETQWMDESSWWLGDGLMLFNVGLGTLMKPGECVRVSMACKLSL